MIKFSGEALQTCRVSRLNPVETRHVKPERARERGWVAVLILGSC